MTAQAGAPTPWVGRFVVPAARPQRDPLLRIGLRLSDRPHVAPGERVEVGQLIVERFREQDIVEVPTTAAIIGLRPGGILDRAPSSARGRRSTRTPATAAVRARLIEHGRDGISRLVAGREELHVSAPASGTVAALTPARLDLRCEGVGIEGRIGWGRPASGRVVIAATGPDAETRASGIDVAVAGAILVVGARIDVEALSRARALGVGAIIVGGVAGRDMRQLEESEARRQAALHSAAPFAILAMGHGRAAIPRHVWDLLVAAEGRPAGVLPSARTLVIGGDPEPLLAAASRPAGTVRIVSGEWREREGRLVGLTGPRRWAEGGYQPGGFVELAGPGGRTERVSLPLAILERLA